jgi:hypothetical protein
VVSSASAALGLPVRSTWNDADVLEGTGFFEIGYRGGADPRGLLIAQLRHGRS